MFYVEHSLIKYYTIIGYLSRYCIVRKNRVLKY